MKLETCVLFLSLTVLLLTVHRFAFFFSLGVRMRSENKKL